MASFVVWRWDWRWGVLGRVLGRVRRRSEGGVVVVAGLAVAREDVFVLRLRGRLE